MKESLRNFSVLWENHFSTKLWYTTLCNFFNPEIFWNTSVPLLTFSVLSDKKGSREVRDIPFLSKKLLDKRFFLKSEGVPYEIVRYCEKINFRQNRDTPSYAISYSRKFLNKRVPLGNFSVLWDKKASRESRDIPLLAIKSSDQRKVLKNEGFPYKILRYCEKINFAQNRDTPSYAIFLIQKYSEKKGPTRKFFGTVRQKSFERKSWYPPSIQKLFRQRKLSEKRRVPLRSFLGTMRKSFFDKIVIHHLMQFF